MAPKPLCIPSILQPQWRHCQSQHQACLKMKSILRLTSWVNYNQKLLSKANKKTHVMQQKPRWLHCNKPPISHFTNPFLTEWSNVSKSYVHGKNRPAIYTSQLAVDHWANRSACPVSNISMENLMLALLYSSRRLG